LETERLVAYLVQEELEKRKKNGTYSGAFAPVTHFFGYQGRSAHPSLFDCSLGSTCGFAAARLIEAGLTAIAVSVKQISQPPEEWRVGGVPIMSILTSYPKEGFERHKLVVRDTHVNLKSAPFQEYKRQVKSWINHDLYTNPGPIQFNYDQNLDREVGDSMKLNFTEVDDLTAEISGLCHSIQNDVLFAEHKHLLVAALSSLKSAKQVINSFARTQ